MILEEFSNEFDILLNSYAYKSGPESAQSVLECDEYEKSVLLTQAQEELAISLYTGRNPSNNSFEGSEEVRRSLSNLLQTYTTTTKLTGKTGVSPYSKFYAIPKDVWFITYEAVTLGDNSLGCWNNKDIIVTPVTQDDYYRINKNPFKNSGKRRALRLDADNYTVEIISKYDVGRYLVKYVRKPAPIILSTLTDGLSINGISAKTECELNPVTHRAILERAVNLALSVKLKTQEK